MIVPVFGCKTICFDTAKPYEGDEDDGELANCSIEFNFNNSGHIFWGSKDSKENYTDDFKFPCPIIYVGRKDGGLDGLWGYENGAWR